MADLTARISQLENQYINNPSSILLKEYLLLKADFDTLSTEEMLIKSRHAYYENGEKANRLLAHQLRQSSASRIIPAIKTHNTLLSDHHEINNSFLEFRLLYSSEQTSDYEDFHNFFKDLSLPHISTNAVQFQMALFLYMRSMMPFQPCNVVRALAQMAFRSKSSFAKYVQ